MEKFTVSAALATTAIIFFVALGQTSEAAIPAQGGTGGEPRSCTKKIVVSACTSCAELGVQDKECKSGTDFEECSATSHTCSNGANCDQHAGASACP